MQGIYRYDKICKACTVATRELQGSLPRTLWGLSGNMFMRRGLSERAAGFAPRLKVTPLSVVRLPFNLGRLYFTWGAFMHGCECSGTRRKRAEMGRLYADRDAFLNQE